MRVGYGADDKLHGVTLEVPKGSFLAVVGPNGSGKSTLLRTMARALKPRLGAVLLDGREVESWGRKSFAREVAVVSQEGPPAFDYTAYEIVELGRTPHSKRLTPDKEGHRAVEKAMREVGVWEFRERRMGNLSGGERQLVTLARALAQEPEVLLLDEPTNHLDIHHQVAFMEVLLRLNASGKTILMVVHDLNLAARYSGRVVVLARGPRLRRRPAERRPATAGDRDGLWRGGRAFYLAPHRRAPDTAGRYPAATEGRPGGARHLRWRFRRSPDAPVSGKRGYPSQRVS